MKLGIFGGTFDPVHYGHLLLAECCAEQCALDQVWFLPASIPPHKKDRTHTAAEHRIEMLKLATAGNERLTVCTYETDRGGVNYTVDTLTHLNGEDPSRELFFLLGGDMLADIPNWREPKKICELAVLVAVHRAGLPPLDFSCLSSVAGPERIEEFRRVQVAMPEMGISASDIRSRVAEGKSIRYQTPRAVEKYIETHGLYKCY
jgi:nicotinate-nucleotide adenylyltransferase